MRPLCRAPEENEFAGCDSNSLLRRDNLLADQQRCPTDRDDVAAAAQEAGSRWEAMIQKETGDATRARVIRLVGDGLAANVIAGIEPAPTPAQLDALLDALIPRPGGASRQ
ncbi:hypothetical protein [Cryobacterium sp. TMT1-19]|uniref:hypothetical protein n=1 Tax=Cryobacterium sp. TMT1-19 TaxID=1259231 RepID=UPI00141B8520|nr:hypothetical protein [Cryobacterium sp. TMT1-19]